MAKASEDAAAAELPLNDERKEPRKLARHVRISVDHLTKERDKLTKKIDAFTTERDGIDTAIKALVSE
jgi:hypothetical protein